MTNAAGRLSLRTRTLRTPWRVGLGPSATLAAATMLAVLGFVAVAVALSTFQAQDRFVALTAIRAPEVFPNEDVTVRAAPLYPTFGDNALHALAAEPLVSSAAPPLGLDAWLEPGEFMVSPDLAGDAEALSARFGRLAGVLPDSSLPSAHARFVLARPSEPMSPNWDATGFGVAGPLAPLAASYSGMFNDERVPRPVAVAGVAVLTTVPALVLLWTTTAAAAGPMAATCRTLEACGADPRTLHLLALRSLTPALATGSFLAALTVGIASVVDVPLPGADFTVRSLDVRASAFTYAGLLGLGVLAAVALVALRVRPGPLAGSSRPLAASPGRGRRRTAIVVPVAVAAASELSVRLSQSDDPTIAGVALIVVIAGAVVVVAGMRAVLGEFLDLTARGLLVLSRHRLDPTATISARLLTGSRSAAAVAGTAGAMLVITGLAATWALVGTAPALEAKQLVADIDGRWYQVTAPRVAEAPSEVLAALPEGDTSVAVVQSVSGSGPAATVTVSLIGDSSALAALGVEPGVVPAHALPYHVWVAVGSEEQPVQVDLGQPLLPAELEARSGGQTFVVFRIDGGRVDQLAAQAALSSRGGLGWSVTAGGEQWPVGASTLAHQMRWLWLLGAVATLMLLAASFVASATDVRSQVRTIAPIQSLYAARGIAARITAVRLLAISAAGLAVGGAASAALARMASGEFAVGLGAGTVVTALTAVTAAGSAVMSVPLVLLAARRGWSWRPGLDDGGEE